MKELINCGSFAGVVCHLSWTIPKPFRAFS